MTPHSLNLPNHPPLTLRRATPAEVIPLRAAVLRPGQPLADSHYPLDPHPDSLHAGIFLPDGQIIAAASLFREPYEGTDAYRLRGMAVHPDYRSLGLGRLTLNFLIAQARTQNVPLLWANARLPAVPFYQHLGWRIQGPQFDIPSAGGPHHLMLLNLTPT